MSVDVDDEHVYLFVPEIDGYVVDCDVSDPTGRGVATFTKDIDEAKPFDSVLDALSFWRRQHTEVPLREDGKPNRPLTAWTVELRRRASLT